MKARHVHYRPGPPEDPSLFTQEPEERWLPVSGYEGLYEVSDLGRVRRLIFINGKTRKPYTPPRILITTKWSNGYLFVDLCKENKVLHQMVHRMVLTAFVGPAPDGMVAAHGNGQRDDPRLVNLRWATWSENEMDKRLHGTDQRGEGNPAAKITEADVRAIRQRRAAGERPIDLAQEYGLSDTNICDICNRHIWTHVA